MSFIPEEYRFSGFRTALERDREFLSVLSGFLIVGLLLMYLLATYHFLSTETTSPERYARIVVGKPGPEGKSGGGSQEKVAQPMPKAVPQAKTQAKAQPKAPKNIPRVAQPIKPQITREQQIAKNREIALQQSLVGVIASRAKASNTALGQVLQRNGIGSEVEKAAKNVRSVRGSGTGSGTAGYGSRGTGSGGGIGNGKGVGFGDGIGTGEVGTGYGGGGDNIDLGVKGTKIVTAQLTKGAATVEGTLDPALIDQVVRKNLPGLKYCYEKELTVSPKLAGKVVVQFTIGTDGSVIAQSIENSSLSSPVVEDCILRRIQRWRFPKPDGGKVIVSYPFVFTTAQ